MTITTKPAVVHGRSRAATSDTGTSRMTRLRSRRSRIAAIPRNRHRVSTWTDSTMGNAHTDSAIATLARVCANHSKKPRRDIGGKHTRNHVLCYAYENAPGRGVEGGDAR